MTSFVLQAICCLLVVTCLLPREVAALFKPDGSLSITLSFVDNFGNPFYNRTCDTTSFSSSINALCTIPLDSHVEVRGSNATSCMFVITPPDVSGALVPCFEAVISTLWADRLTVWEDITNPMPKGVGIVVTPSVTRIAIGMFTDDDFATSGDAFFKYMLITCLVFYVVVFLLYVWDSTYNIHSKIRISTGLGQVFGCFLVVFAVAVGLAFYFVETAVTVPPLISTGSTTTVETCYVSLQDITPWKLIAINTDTATFASSRSDAKVERVGNDTEVKFQWPCKIRLFYNPYDVVFGANGERTPLTFSLTSSTLVVQSDALVTHVPLVIRSTSSQLAANRVYLSNSSFFSIDVSLVSGIGYVGSTITHPNQTIAINATSVFVVSERAENPKSVVVTHVANPPLFCIGPKVTVNFNASACTSSSGASTTSGGGNETYSGITGYCTLQAHDPVNASIPFQRIVIRTVSFYMLPSAPAPISSKVVGAGFENPPGLSENILLAINSSQTWVSAYAFNSYVQNIDIVTPLLGIKMLNTNFPSILQFFPELIKWLTAFVLNPPYRTLQAVPDHFTCDDDITIEGLVPPITTLIMYLDNGNLTGDLTSNNERFANKVLESTFNAVDSSSVPGSLTSFQLPMEAWQIRPSLQRETFVNSRQVTVDRPPIADLLISVSAILAFLLISAITVLFVVFGKKIYNFLSWGDKRDLVEWAIASMEKARKGNAKEQPPATDKPESEDPSGFCASFLRKLVRFGEAVWSFINQVSRALNGLSYRMTLKTTNSLRFLWVDEHESFESFLQVYVEFQTAEDANFRAITVEELTIMYRSFCKIFDRLDGEEYKKESALRKCIGNAAVKLSVAKNQIEAQRQFIVQDGYVRSLRMKMMPNSAVTKFEVDVREVQRMISANNLNFAFGASRTSTCDPWYDRLLRHPILLGGTQTFYYCFLQLMPIAFSSFCLFALQLAMVDYQITAVIFRDSDTAAAYLISFYNIGEWTLQVAVMWIFYICVTLVLLERLLQAWGAVILHITADRIAVEELVHSQQNGATPSSDKEKKPLVACGVGVKFVPPAIVLSATVRFLVFIPYILCTLFMFGYILLVALWWILTCFLAPNVMIPFAASGISLLSSVYGVYRSLKGCKQKLLDYIDVKIELEVNRFLQAIRIDFSDDNNVVIANETSDDFDSKAKFIASTSQIPLPIVEFGLNPRDDDARLRLAQFFAPLSSPEFQNLLSFCCSTTTDVDDVASGAKPFVEALLPPPPPPPPQPNSGESDVSTYQSGLLEAQRGLVLSLLQSLILPQADGGCLNNAAIHRGVMRAWKSDMLYQIDSLLASAKSQGTISSTLQDSSAKVIRLGALRQLVIGFDEFLKTRQLQNFCDRISKLLPMLFTTDNVDALAPFQDEITFCRIALPIVGKLAWLFSDSIVSFQESFNFVLLALPNEQRQTMETIAMDVADILKKTVEELEKQEHDAQTSAAPADVKKPVPLPNDENSHALEMKLLPDPTSDPANASKVPTQVDDHQGELARFGADGALLYAALTSVSENELVWSIPTLQQCSDDLTNSSFSIISLMQTPPKDENISIRSQWVMSLKRGTAWPTLELELLFPTLSQAEYATLRKFSLAGVNPGSFMNLTGWQSCSSISQVQRETKCLAAWIKNISDDPKTFQFAAEAYFYSIVWDYMKRNGSRDDLLNRCLEVSCPILLGCLDATNSKDLASLDNFVATNVKKISTMPELIRCFGQCASAADVGNNWIECCRRDCTPMYLLCTADPVASLKAVTSKGGETHLEELRRYTGLRIALDKDQLKIDPDATLSTLESVYNVATMQQHAPEAVLQTLSRLQFRANQTAPSDQTDSDDYTPKGLAAMPMCGIHLLQKGLELEALEQRRNAIIVASAIVKVPLFAYAASLKPRIDSTSTPLGTILIESVLTPQPAAVTNSCGSENRFMRKAFKHLPTVMSLLQSNNSVPDGFGQRIARLVAALDIIGGECLHPDDETKPAKYGTFTPQCYNDVACLVDFVTGATTTPNEMVNVLKIVLAIAAGEGDLDPKSVIPTLSYLSSLLSAACGIDLLPQKYIGVTQFFARQDDGDVFGLLNECVTPLLSSSWTASIPPFAFAVANAARVHKHKRRPSALLEIFRDYVDQIIVLTTNNPIFAVPATPVERWLLSLQRYASEGTISHLQSACIAATGSQYTAAGWNVLLHHVELQRSSGKKRALAIASTFKATVATVPKEKIGMLVDRLKKTPLFAPLADRLEELLKPDQTLDHLGEKLVDSVKQYIISTLHISSSDIVRILIFLAVMLSFMVTFILLGIVAFSNGSTFSSLIGVAFPVVGGSMSQYDSASFLEGLKEKADEIIDDLSGGTPAQQENDKKQKQKQD